MKTKPSTKNRRVKEAVSLLVQSAGCSCCRSNEGWDEAKEILAKLLGFKKYTDGSGYNFALPARKGKIKK